jgi:hypothetical protein
VAWGISGTKPTEKVLSKKKVFISTNTGTRQKCFQLPRNKMTI